LVILTRKLIKGSKDSDFSLVCNTHLSQTVASCGWDLGPDDLIPKG